MRRSAPNLPASGLLSGELNPADLTCDRLTADYWLWQRKKGHRFSSDDIATAWFAMSQFTNRDAPARILDLGCGIGSVLCHLAWSVPSSTLVGVEAQAVSYALLQRNLDHNALRARTHTIHGDLRDPAIIAQLAGPFDLITGTPPYFPPATAVDALDEQRAFARIEYRGGIEAYVATAAPLLATNAPLVLCGDADADHRAVTAASAHGLAVTARCVVLPRAGAKPLFAMWVMERASSQLAAGQAVAVPANPRYTELCLRDAAGLQTDDAKRLRRFSGL